MILASAKGLCEDRGDSAIGTSWGAHTVLLLVLCDTPLAASLGGVGRVVGSDGT